MKVILFCQNNYAFGILSPIREVLEAEKHEYIWYITKKLSDTFPFKSERHTSLISDLEAFKSDVIFVPGNQVPYHLRGLKVQIFHGLAGEKKGHFRMRHYFDLYLTQGPYFTKAFKKLKEKHQDFDVIETGWPKLDVLSKDSQKYIEEKANLLKTYKADKIILYAPTFSPKLTSAPFLLDEITDLAQNSDYLILMKFHPLMDDKWVEKYKTLADEIPNIIFYEESNIIKFLFLSDILISDTSSVIYEFMLLNKPVITFKSIAKHIVWENSLEYQNLKILVDKNLKKDPHAKGRQHVYQEYHPYNDGLSSKRMVDTVNEYIKTHGVPLKRILSLSRKLKIHTIFGKPKFIKEKKESLNKSINLQKEKLSVIITTKNEAHNIRGVIESVLFADEIIIVDSYSTDNTVAIAETYPTKILKRVYNYPASQKNWAIPQAKHEWILLLDADERVTPQLKDEVVEFLKNPNKNGVSGYWVYRINDFMGKRVKYSGWQNDKVIRLFRRNDCRYEDKMVHEEIITSGKIDFLKNKLYHNTYVTLDNHLDKLNRYATWQAIDYNKKTGKLTLFHFVVKPFWSFFKHFIIQQGFRDGVVGFTIACLQAYSVLFRYVKLWQLRNNSRDSVEK